ncbi:MAG: 5-oxoprolinase subunit PxpB [Phycisphaerales bacterium]|nr:5-oxoprolinase subunit PxpB [Phycisphaerales bacterium]
MPGFFVYWQALAEQIDLIEVLWVSERHVRISLGDGDLLRTHQRIMRSLERIRSAGIEGLVDVTPAYRTLLVSFDSERMDPDRAIPALLEAVSESHGTAAEAPARLVEIPACYGGEYGPDLPDLAAHAKLSIDEVIRWHSSTEFLVHFIGFVPGFAYMGGLPQEFAMPRLDQPRVRIPAGSIGIAGDQTGIYPHVTPGGWRLIARTPLKMFDAGRPSPPSPPSPCLLSAGDRVRFVPITADRFAELAKGTGR